MNMNTGNVHKILIADDDKDILFILEALLVRNGYKVLTAQNGKEVFDVALENNPDLIIMDISMPVMGGYESCEKLRNNMVTQDIPVIFLSGLADMEDKKRALEVGGDDYLVKPFSEAELLMRIRSVVRISNLKKQQSDSFQQIIRSQAEKMMMLETISMGVAHEISNPLAAIMSNLAIIGAVVKEDMILDSIEEIKEQVHRIDDVTKRLLKLADNNVQYFKEESFTEIFDDIFAISQLYADKRDIKIVVDSKIEDTKFFCDLDQLILALTSIIRNSVDFSNENSEVHISVQRDDNNVLIEISDRGKGIAEENIENIFHPFFSSEQATHLGLGLSIAKGVIDNHFGKIDVFSTLGEGTTFKITLPIVGKNKKVMIVDDDRQILKHMKIILERSGYQCCCADNGKKGLEVLEENPDVDIIVSDFFMPVMDGFEFTKKVKENDSFKQIPVVAYTGFATPQNIEEAKKVGIVEIMPKPFALDEFKDVLEKYL